MTSWAIVTAGEVLGSELASVAEEFFCSQDVQGGPSHLKPCLSLFIQEWFYIETVLGRF